MALVDTTQLQLILENVSLTNKKDREEAEERHAKREEEMLARLEAT